MAVRDLYSKRRRRALRTGPDVYTYDRITPAFREQLLHIMQQDVLGDCDSLYFAVASNARSAWKRVHDQLAREYGVSTLAAGTPREALVAFVRTKADVDEILDLVELLLDGAPQEITDEVNIRFREQALGYEYVQGQIIRIDSRLIHQSAILPALDLLSDPLFAGANQEFLAAHEHYRRGDYEPAMNEALKAFESTLKIICQARGWQYAPTDTASKLIDIAFSNGLVDRFWQSEFTALAASLKDGVPTGRNKQAGHGQGPAIRQVPQYIAEYVLNMTASGIVFLAEAFKSLP